MERLTRAEQIARSKAWMSYVRKRRVLDKVASGEYANKDDTGMHKEAMKNKRRLMGEIVKKYPDFPARYERKGLVGATRSK